MIIQGKLPKTGDLVNVFVEQSAVVRVEPVDGRTRFDHGGPDYFLCRGFFDPQVNGFGGVDFNAKDLDPEKIHRALYSLASSGVTRFLPTLITASHERIVHQLNILARAFEKDPLLEQMCPGIHLEGPYISPRMVPGEPTPGNLSVRPSGTRCEKFQEGM